MCVCVTMYVSVCLCVYVVPRREGGGAGSHRHPVGIANMLALKGHVTAINQRVKLL